MGMMMKSITREKHLDHMVRVVPFIVFCYAIQCYAIMKMEPLEAVKTILFCLGAFLAFMIAAFVTYDLKHEVHFRETHLEINFFVFTRKISYDDVWSVEVSDPGQSFSTLKLETKSGNYSFFFLDDADKIKTWLEEKKLQDLKAA